MQCKACDETNLALLLLFNQEPALRFPYERLGEDLQSEFLIYARDARGDELKKMVEKWCNENAKTSPFGMRKERRCLKRATASVFLNSPDLKKRMGSKHGELHSIISAGPSYMLNAGPPGNIKAINMYAVDAVEGEEHPYCHLVVYNAYTQFCNEEHTAHAGRSPSCEV